MENVLPKKENLIPVSEVEERSGVSYNTLRYYTKIGLLPHMTRKLPHEGAKSTVGHYPEHVLEDLEDIAQYKEEDLSNDEIKQKLQKKRIKRLSNQISEEETKESPPPQPATAPSPPPIDLIPVLREEQKQTNLLSQISHFLSNMIHEPLPAQESLFSKVATHTLTLALVFGALAILSLGFSDLTHARIKRMFGNFWDQYANRIIPGNVLGTRKIASPIVDVNDVLEYRQEEGSDWIAVKLPALFDKAKYVGTVVFGRGEEYFINPLGDASLNNVSSTSLETTTIDSNKIEAKNINTTTLSVSGKGVLSSINRVSIPSSGALTLEEGQNITITEDRVGGAITISSSGGGNGGIATGGDADTLESESGNFYLSWSNFTGTPVILSSLNGVSNNEGNVDLVAGSNVSIATDDGANTITISSTAGSDADTLDGQDGTYYLDLSNEVGTCANCLSTTEIDETTFSGLNSSNINDIYLFNTGDTASGSYTFQDDITLGSTSTDSLTINALISSDIVPVDNVRNLGSAANRWALGYFDEVVVNTLSAGSTDVSGTISSDFTLNSDNSTNDLEDSTITFERGSPINNAVIRWDSANDRYQFESFPLYLDNQLISAVSTGTAPLVVNSTTLVANLNSDQLDSIDSTQLLRSDTSDNFTSGTLTFDVGTTLSIAGSLSLPTSGITGAGSGSGLDSDLLDGQHGTYFLDLDNQTGTCANCLSTTEVDETTFSGVNADTLDSIDSSSFLRSDTSDNYTSGTLTVDAGTTLDVNGTLIWGSENSRIETQDDITVRIARSGFYQTSTATLAEGWPEDDGSWYHLLNVQHSNNANNYALQLAADYHEQDLFFRSTNDSGTQAWSRVVLENPNGGIFISETAAPGTPPSGKVTIYAKTDGNLYSKNDGGNESQLGGVDELFEGQYHPDRPPQTAGSADDEFRSPTLSGWSIDSGSITSGTISDWHPTSGDVYDLSTMPGIFLFHTDNSGSFTQPLLMTRSWSPGDTDWAAAAKVLIPYNDDTDDGYFFGLRLSNGAHFRIGMRAFTNKMTTFSSFSRGTVELGNAHMSDWHTLYMAMTHRAGESVIRGYLSKDGVSWTYWGTASYSAISSIQLALEQDATPSPLPIFGVDWVRTKSGATPSFGSAPY